MSSIGSAFQIKSDQNLSPVALLLRTNLTNESCTHDQIEQDCIHVIKIKNNQRTHITYFTYDQFKGQFTNAWSYIVPKLKEWDFTVELNTVPLLQFMKEFTCGAHTLKIQLLKINDL